MSEQFQPPFRMPCEEVSGKPSIYAGSPFQHAIGNWKVDKYVNTTTVPNWDTGVGGTIPPYETFNADVPACAASGCNPGVTPCGGAWTEPVPANTFAHTPGDQVDFAVARKHGWKGVQGARNWHGSLPWTAPEAGCKTNLCADGVTGYQAYQSTPSQTKYLTATYSSTVNNHFDAGEDSGGYWHASKSGARTVNAQSGEITSSLTTSEERAANFGSGPVIIRHVDAGAGYTDVDGDGTHDSDFTSGGTTLVDTLDVDLHCNYPHFRADDVNDLPGFINAWNSNPFHVTPMPLMTDPNNYSCIITSADGPGSGTWTVDATFNRNATSVSWDFTITQNDPSDGEVNTWSYSGSITLSDPNPGDSVLADIYDNLLATWPLNDDKLYPPRTDKKGSIAPYLTRHEVSKTTPLGFNPVNVNDLTQPIADADGHAPFSTGWTPTYNLTAWFDDRIFFWQFAAGTDSSNAAATGLLEVFDGAILGAPLPAGYQDYFDFRFIDQRGCCSHPTEGENQWTWYPYGAGMKVSAFNALSGAQIPLNATQWNTFFQAANKPKAAWVIYADQANYFPGDCINSSDSPSTAGDADAIVACKYAEILEQWNSQDFSLPAGDMKFWYDETRVYCATNVSGTGAGSVWALIDPKTGVAPITTPEIDDIWGGPSVGGFYLLAGWDGTNVTLGAKQFDVPSNWASKSNGDDATCFGPLRFPTAPSLLGRAAITTSGTTATFASAQPAFGMSETGTPHTEQIDIYDASMTSLATNITATRVNDTSYSTSASYPTAKFITIHGAPKWYMHDADPKGDLTVLQWWFDYRNPGEAGRLAANSDCSSVTLTGPASVTYTNSDCNGASTTVAFPGLGYARFCQQQLCIPFRPCAPRVICISPNGEIFPNGQTIAMPTSLVWDEQYGTRYQAVPEPVMTDLFWQPPHFPCNIGTCDNWKEDDGNCHSNADALGDECSGNECPDNPCNLYYALAPQVEARLSIPTNYGPAQDETAPALPSGIQIGWLSPVDHDSSVSGVAFPPTAPGPTSSNGAPADCSFAWDLHAILCAGGCRFSYNYPGC